MKPVPLLLVLCAGAFARTAHSANGGAEPVGFWRFEKDVKSEVQNAGVGAAKRRAGAEFF